MSERPVTRNLVRRVRRRMDGGRFDMRIYDDGSMRIRVDHPSDDPEIEMAMAGRMFKVARHVFAEVGLGEPVMGPVISDILGHSTTRITADLYRHHIPALSVAAAERMQEALG